MAVASKQPKNVYTFCVVQKDDINIDRDVIYIKNPSSVEYKLLSAYEKQMYYFALILNVLLFTFDLLILTAFEKVQTK